MMVFIHLIKLIKDLKNKYEQENNQLLKNNLKLILDYCKELKEKDITR